MRRAGRYWSGTAEVDPTIFSRPERMRSTAAYSVVVLPELVEEQVRVSIGFDDVRSKKDEELALQ